MSLSNSNLKIDSRLNSSFSKKNLTENFSAEKVVVERIAKDLLNLVTYSMSKSYSTVAGSSSGAFLSQIEQAILQSSTSPVEINESEEITVNNQRGIWANRAEVVNWKGSVPITEYQINEDSNPEIITKGSKQKLEYIQELAIRYLRPPTPPTPGEIIINQEANGLVAPAPPLIIRQQPARPETPEPLVIREAPPKAPAPVGQKVITISGKRVPPPPRKVVIERLAPLPSKPQSVLVERWLPYAQVKRRVIFRGAQADPVLVKPRNVIVQWEAPQVVVKKEFKYLGVIKANPAEYVQRYSTSLVQSSALPQFVQDIKTPDGLVLAANSKQAGLYELEGDLQAFKLVDLDREGLSEYRAYLQKLGISFNGNPVGLQHSLSSRSLMIDGEDTRLSISAIVDLAFKYIDENGNNSISVEETEKAILRINSRLIRSYGEDDVVDFFDALDTNNDGSLSKDEFEQAFLNLLKSP